MDRRGQRIRRNNATRTYPIYTISGSELSDDDESIIEIKPTKRHRHHRTHQSRVRPHESTREYVIAGNKT